MGELSAIVESLTREMNRLQAQHQTAQATVDHLEEEIRKVEHALQLLRGHRPRQRRGRRKTLTSPQVIALTERVLKHEGPLKEPQLMEKVMERAVYEGKSKSGLALLLQEVLHQGPFVFNGARWQLVS